MKPQVAAVSRKAEHALSKTVEPSIRLVAGLGVQGDAHAGVTVQHRSHVKRNPVVLASGAVRAGDGIEVLLPDEPHEAMQPV